MRKYTLTVFAVLVVNLSLLHSCQIIPAKASSKFNGFGLYEWNDSNEISGPDTGEEEEDDFPSALTSQRISPETAAAYTLQGTKARTLRSRTVYIVNGKKRYKN